MKRLTWLAAALAAGWVVTVNELHGQTVNPATDSVIQLTASARDLPLVSPTDLPKMGTFWMVLPSRNGGLLAPLPCPPEDVSLSIFQVAKNIFIIDGTYGQDTGTNAVLADAAAVANLIDLVQTPKIQRQRMAMSLSGPPMPGGGGGTNVYYPNGNSYTPPDYGTNLWIAQVALTNGWLTGIASNTLADVAYELQSRTNLTQNDWQSEGFIYGSETTNWTALAMAQQGRPNLFLRLLSWQDTYGLGIPDWWQLAFFNMVGIDPDASAAHDGFSNLYKFQHGLNPTNYYNPDLPGNFFGAVTGTNAFLYWDKETGATGYLVRRGVLDPGTGNYTYTPFLLDSNATWFADGALTNANAQNDLYTLQAVFPGGGLSGTNTWQVWWYASYASYGPPYGPPPPGHVYAYADATQTNVQIAWTAAASSRATNYVVERGTNNGGYVYFPIAWTGSNATAYTDTGVLTNADNWGNAYAVAAVYPGGGLSYAVSTYSWTSPTPISLGADTNASAAPANFFGYTDWLYYPVQTGTNLFLTWDAVPGAVSYLLYARSWSGNLSYQPLARTSGTTFELAGGTDGEGNYTYDDFAVTAVFANGSLSQSASWSVGNSLPPNQVSAYVDATGTNVVVAWSPVPGATGYRVSWSDYAGYENYSEIAETGAGTTFYTDVDGVAAADYGLEFVGYEVAAVFPNGGLSPAVTTMVSNAPASPVGLTATVDATGTNVTLAWNAAVGPVSSYTILRGTYDPNTGQYSYASIGTVAANTTAFTDPGAAGGNNLYEVEANYAGGLTSLPSALASLHSPAPPATANLRVGAQLIRNAAGRWELVFSDLPPGVEQVAFSWYLWDYFYDLGFERITDYYNNGEPLTSEHDIPVSRITNGVYVLPDFLTTNWFPNNAYGKAAMLQPIGTNGDYGSLSFAGFQSYDSPVFVDARQHLKENLRYQLRSATISQPKAPLVENGVWWDPFFENENIPVDTNYVESSLYHWSVMFKGYNVYDITYLKRDNIWPITANYELHGGLYDTNSPVFNWQPDPGSLSFQSTLATVPAPAVLGIPDPYWIPQPITVSGGIDPATGLPLNTTISVLPDLAAYTNNGALYLRSDAHNLFGLAFADALVGQSGSFDPYTGQWLYTPTTILAPGGSTSVSNVNCFYSQTVAPDLQAAGYYFAPVNTPGTALPNEVPQTQLYPLPALPGFANTNQTGLLVASVGAPFALGGWAKLSIHNGDPAKFAYLGQYFVTNAFVVTNGVVATNTTGIVSPYGDFFPTAPGLAALVTLPDLDTGLQGTGLVRVVSLNVDANHDGTMDFSYRGPDFASVGRPFRFWVNDDQDSGDYGGDGVPGANLADGMSYSLGLVPDLSPTGLSDGKFYRVHGRRDLVDFFPVYLNIGSLFQSNALSAGISVTDTNYQFVLSQADGVLRFVYTDLTPTNYLDFLQDTNVSGRLADETAWPISAQGFPLNNTFNTAFIRNIATNNGGIILVEAAANTTQPLVLTIYHGTNQIAQTSLPLSITGVEQMFRHKNLLLSASPVMPDRLTDADVTNEPDTIDKNFVFVHGYNVNPQEARGNFADMFKRLYWSGSHAKFYAVTWEGYDTKGGPPFFGALTPNYHTNVYNAFLTAPLLANFITTLTNSGPVVLAAHSLGNMVTLSAISDWNAPISQYFMLDAAVPIEAIDVTSSTNAMIPSAWLAYSNRLFASSWYQLFPTNDSRNTLNWKNRLGNLGSVDVYNFYSSGEEVLRTYLPDAPDGGWSAISTKLSGLWPSGTPLAAYAWAWQEKGKGVCDEDWFIGSSHGGWRFSDYYYGVPVSSANSTAYTPDSLLRQQPFFDFSRAALVGPPSPDLALTNAATGSTYAAANRNRILADAIPALSLPIGANPVPSFDDNHNKDMMTFENGWSQGRLNQQELNKWHHSDFHEMAYTFTYKLFNQFVTLGNLE